MKQAECTLSVPSAQFRKFISLTCLKISGCFYCDCSIVTVLTINNSFIRIALRTFPKMLSFQLLHGTMRPPHIKGRSHPGR